MCMLHEQITWGLLTSVSVSYKVKPLGHKADKTPHLNPNCWSPQSLTITLSFFFFFFLQQGLEINLYYRKFFFNRKTQGLSVIPVLHPFVTL